MFQRGASEMGQLTLMQDDWAQAGIPHGGKNSHVQALLHHLQAHVLICGFGECPCQREMEEGIPKGSF